MEKGRKTLFAQMVTYTSMYGGEILRDIEAAILKKKQFCTVTLASVSNAYEQSARLVPVQLAVSLNVTNYFHYIGAGHHFVWMYRNEGVESFNKTLSRRSNIFNV
jgi:hypothetical protein